jgi:hypothetical protein
MSRSNITSWRRVFGQANRSARRLTFALAVTTASGLLLVSGGTSVAQPDYSPTQCSTAHFFGPGPIVNGHHRQPTQAEIDERTRERSESKTSARVC